MSSLTINTFGLVCSASFHNVPTEEQHSSMLRSSSAVSSTQRSVCLPPSPFFLIIVWIMFINQVKARLDYGTCELVWAVSWISVVFRHPHIVTFYLTSSVCPTSFGDCWTLFAIIFCGGAMIELEATASGQAEGSNRSASSLRYSSAGCSRV